MISTEDSDTSRKCECYFCDDNQSFIKSKPTSRRFRAKRDQLLKRINGSEPDDYLEVLGADRDRKVSDIDGTIMWGLIHLRCYLGNLVNDEEKNAVKSKYVPHDLLY